MKRPLRLLKKRLIFTFFLGLGYGSVLGADSIPEPGPPGVYADLMPSILVKGVYADTLPSTLQPEYVLSDESPIKITMTGLPPGLNLNEDRTIRGTPTKTGIYRTKIQVSNQYGTSQPSIWIVQIVDEAQKDFGPGGSFLSIAAPEIYNGVDNPQLNRRIARMELEVTPAGAFSGSLMILQGKQRFAGQLKMNPDDEMERVAEIQLKNLPGGATRVLLRIVQTSRPGFLRWLAVQISANEYTSDSVTLYPRLKPNADERRVLVGRHNIALKDDQASGFASVFLSRGQNATMTGTLPDGTGFTTSSPLVRESIYNGEAFMPVGYDGKKDGIVHGSISFGYNLTADGAYLGGTVGQLQWISPPKKRSTWPDGFERQLRVDGGLYVLPREGELLLSGAARSAGNARLNFTGALLDFPDYSLQTFTLNAAHQAIFPAGTDNPNRARIDFYAPTGFFTGQFRFVYSLPGPVFRKPSRLVQFRGMIIPSDGIRNSGQGFFLLPSPPDPNGYPPTSWADSPILSGGVRVYVE